MISITEAVRAFGSATESPLNELRAYLDPYAEALPDARFSEGLYLLAAGMLAARSPQPAKAVAHAPQPRHSKISLAKRFYRLLKTPRFGHRHWLKALYADARSVVQASAKERIIVALDPANFGRHMPNPSKGSARCANARHQG